MTTEKSVLPQLPKVPKVPGSGEIEKRIRPDILQTALLDEIVGRLEALENLSGQLKTLAAYIAQEMERVAEGIVYPVELTVTGSRTTEFDLEKEAKAGHRPWFSCTVYADGPDTLWVAINTTAKGFSRIEVAEALSVDFHSPKIKKLYFYTVKDGTCALRIVGER